MKQPEIYINELTQNKCGMFSNHTHNKCMLVRDKSNKTLRKYAYPNILKILQPKKLKFSDKKLIFFIFLLKI